MLPINQLATHLPNNTDKKIVLLHWNGRFGNRMFTYAFLRQYAEDFNLKIYLPSDWEGTKLLKHQPHEIIADDELRLYLNQTDKAFDNLDARLGAIAQFNKKNNDNIQYMNPDVEQDYGKINVCIDSLCCYSPHIFKQYSRKKMVEDYFAFSDEITQSDLYKRLEDNQGKYVVAHLRRDDVSDANNKTNRGYSVISKESYLKAFKKYGYDPKDVVWVTDDKTGKWGVNSTAIQGGWSYPTGSECKPEIFFNWFPDFLKLKFAKAIFRANSSFSWWAAFLSNAEVYAPRLHKRVLFHETNQELAVEFEKGNHPHWICVQGKDNCDDIIIL
jgi:hypothetical protein